MQITWATRQRFQVILKAHCGPIDTVATAMRLHYMEDGDNSDARFRDQFR